MAKAIAPAFEGSTDRPLSGIHEVRALRSELRRQRWRVAFLLDALDAASTQVERGLILDWLHAAKVRQVHVQARLDRRPGKGRPGAGRRRGRDRPPRRPGAETA